MDYGKVMKVEILGEGSSVGIFENWDILGGVYKLTMNEDVIKIIRRDVWINIIREGVESGLLTRY